MLGMQECGWHGVEGSLGGWSVDVCCSSQEGKTALHFSAQNGHVDVAKELLDRGADVAATTTDVRVECVVHVV